MNRLFFISLIGIILFITSCSSKEDDPFKIDEEEWWEQYWMNECYGCKVRDTTGLQIRGNGMQDSNGNPLCLVGFKNQRLWIGKFDEQSKELIKEWIIDKNINLSVQIQTGYGEYIEDIIHSLRISGLIETSNRTIISVTGYKTELGYNFDKSFLIFQDTYTTDLYVSTSLSSIIPWYKDSFLYYLDVEDDTNEKDIYTCFSIDGDILLTGKTKSISNSYHPIDYQKYISFKGISHQDFIFNIDYISYEEKEPITVYMKNIMKDEYAQYEYEFIEYDENYVKVHFNIIEYSGERHSHTFKINIEIGEYEEI